MATGLIGTFLKGRAYAQDGAGPEEGDAAFKTWIHFYRSHRPLGRLIFNPPISRSKYWNKPLITCSRRSGKP